MEIVYLPALSPDADSLGARRSREFTVLLHGLNQLWHSTISSQLEGCTAFLSFSYPKFGSVCPRQLLEVNEGGAGKSP